MSIARPRPHPASPACAANALRSLDIPLAMRLRTVIDEGGVFDANRLTNCLTNWLTARYTRAYADA